MPYSRNSDLPDTVTTVLPTGAQTLFREAFNAYYYENQDTAGFTESDAFGVAWSAVDREYEHSDGGKWVKKAMVPKPLYVYRKVLNADEIIEWAKSVGFETTVPADQLHVTVIYSRQPVDWFEMETDWAGDNETGELTAKPGGPRKVSQFGDAVVLQFSNSMLQWRHEDLRRNGASHDYDYSPHVTLTYDKPDSLDIDAIEAYNGKIVLGPEVFEDINDNFRDTFTEKFSVVKVNSEQRMVYGWASVITKNGVPVVDHQEDVIKADELVNFTTDFMFEDMRTGLYMHAGDTVAKIVHSFPLVDDICKSLGIQCDQEGWIVGVKVLDDDVWKKVKAGELAAFSIGAKAVRKPYNG